MKAGRIMNKKCGIENTQHMIIGNIYTEDYWVCSHNIEYTLQENKNK